jgi:hypothetical protein
VREEADAIRLLHAVNLAAASGEKVDQVAAEGLLGLLGALDLAALPPPRPGRPHPFRPPALGRRDAGAPAKGTAIDLVRNGQRVGTRWSCQPPTGHCYAPPGRQSPPSPYLVTVSRRVRACSASGVPMSVSSASASRQHKRAALAALGSLSRRSAWPSTTRARAWPRWDPKDHNKKRPNLLQTVTMIDHTCTEPNVGADRCSGELSYNVARDQSALQYTKSKGLVALCVVGGAGAIFVGGSVAGCVAWQSDGKVGAEL